VTRRVSSYPPSNAGTRRTAASDENLLTVASTQFAGGRTRCLDKPINHFGAYSISSFRRLKNNDDFLLRI